MSEHSFNHPDRLFPADPAVRDIARAAAGHYDLYICREDDQRRGREPGQIPAMLRAELMEAGVDDARIQVVPDEQEATATALSLGQPGDLVMVFADAIKRSWKQIIYFKPGEDSPVETLPANPSDDYEPLEMEGEAFEPEPGVELVRDGRGVMIAPDPEEAD